MPTRREQRAAELFKAALERCAEERRAFLNEQCAGDPALRTEIESLLAADAAADQFLEPHALITDTLPGQEPAHSMIGRQIGNYKIRRLIATGGMGSVYEAQQEQPRRAVALKLMKRGIASRSALRRFEYEAQLLGRLRHPNIAQIYEAGTDDDGSGGVPYFAMEYIPRAVPITEYAIANKLAIAQRLELFIQVCDAVYHGHQKGIIHRDLKPSNILVDSAGQPKIIDFGVARSTDSDMALTTIQTSVGQLIGTLQYMSPEQCEADPHDIDTRSDVYALGVVLYELLCDKLPYDVASVAMHEATRIIREQNPTRMSTVDRTLRGDVETIVFKALEKDRERRYHSAAELGEDIRRYLSNLPITARPPSVIYQLRTFARRNRAFVGGLTAVFVVLIVGLIVSTSLYFRAEDARAAEARKTAELKIVTQFQKRMLADVDPFLMGRGIIEDLRNRVETRLAGPDLDEEQVAAALFNFDEYVRGVNTTDLALKVIDERILTEAAEMIQAEFIDQPLIRAELEQTLADSYKKFGLYEAAMPLQESALEIRRRELGDEHADTLGSVYSMGDLLVDDERHPDAERYLREAFETRRRVFGDDHQDTLSSLLSIGWLALQIGNLDQALLHATKALEGRRRVLGDSHPDTLESNHYMGAVLSEMKKYEEARLYFQEALEGRRVVLGSENRQTLTSISRMGDLLMDMGRYDEAEGHLREALQTRRRVLGDDHPDVLGSLIEMGTLYSKQERYAESEPYVREALKLTRRVNGDDHWDTGLALNKLGNLMAHMSRFDEAEPYLLAALEIIRRQRGKDHPDTVVSVQALGNLYKNWGRYDEAESYLRAALERGRRGLGDDHRATLSSLRAMGELLMEVQRFDEAELYVREAMKGYWRVIGQDHPDTARAIRLMSVLRRRTGRYTSARYSELPAATDRSTWKKMEYQRVRAGGILSNDLSKKCSTCSVEGYLRTDKGGLKLDFAERLGNVQTLSDAGLNQAQKVQVYGILIDDGIIDVVWTIKVEAWSRLD